MLIAARVFARNIAAFRSEKLQFAAADASRTQDSNQGFLEPSNFLEVPIALSRDRLKRDV